MIPAGIEGKLIIGDDIRTLLNVGEVVQDDHRHVLEAERACGAQASVSGEDARVLIHEDGIGKPKLAYAARNLLDLLGAVRSWISVVRLKTTHGPVLDLRGRINLHYARKSVAFGIFFSDSPEVEARANTQSRGLENRTAFHGSKCHDTGIARTETVQRLSANRRPADNIDKRRATSEEQIPLRALPNRIWPGSAVTPNG